MLRPEGREMKTILKWSVQVGDKCRQHPSRPGSGFAFFELGEFQKSGLKKTRIIAWIGHLEKQNHRPMIIIIRKPDVIRLLFGRLRPFFEWVARGRAVGVRAPQDRAMGDGHRGPDTEARGEAVEGERHPRRVGGGLRRPTERREKIWKIKVKMKTYVRAQK